MSEAPHEITCDGCGEDITYTSNQAEYRLVLAVQSKTPWYVKEGLSGGAVTAMPAYPPIDATKHFCDLCCVHRWLEAEAARV